MAVRRRANQGRRKEIEDWLDSHGVDWEYWDTMDLDAFDEEKSLKNQARIFTQLDETVVEQYATAVKRGDAFPAVVGYRLTKSAKIVCVDGNHRYRAHLVANKPIDTYLITKASQQTLVMMTFEANARHGLPHSIDERVSHAIWLVDNGMSQEEASARMQVSSNDMKRAWARVKADRRATEVGILSREWDAISQTSRSRLANISTDEGFRAAASLVFRASLDAAEVFTMVAELNRTRSASKQVAMVKNFEGGYSERIQELASGGGTSRRAQTPKQTFHRVLTSISGLPDNVTVLVERFADTEREEAAKRAREASTYLGQVADKLEAGQSRRRTARR